MHTNRHDTRVRVQTIWGSLLGLAILANYSSAGVLSTGGELAQTAPPASVRQGDAGLPVIVLQENKSFTLEAPLTVDVTTTNVVKSLSDLSGDLIDAGTRINSYFLSVDAVFGTIDGTGDVTFSEDFLGVIATEDSLQASHRLLGAAATSDPFNGSSEASQAPFELSGFVPDKFTVDLDDDFVFFESGADSLVGGFGGGGNYDQMRIITAATNSAGGCNADDTIDILDANCTPGEALQSFLDDHGFPLGAADGDGTVQLSDFGILSSNFRQSGEYTDGDFDKSGLIDFQDFVILAMHFGTTATIATVPEPVPFTSCLLSLLAILTLIRRANRRPAARQPTRGADRIIEVCVLLRVFVRPRYYDWQLEQTPEASWRGCHARNLLGPTGYQALLENSPAKPDHPRTSPRRSPIPPKARRPPAIYRGETPVLGNFVRSRRSASLGTTLRSCPTVGAKELAILLLISLVWGYQNLAAHGDIKSLSGELKEIDAPFSVSQGATPAISIFEEQQSLTLTSSLDVDITTSGVFDEVVELTPGRIDAGTTINSYFFQLEKPFSFFGSTALGEAVFSEEILGVIATEAKLQSSHDIVGHPSTAYPSNVSTDAGRAPFEFGSGDAITVDLPRSRVAFNASGFIDAAFEPGGLYDQMRIITAATDSAGDCNEDGNIDILDADCTGVEDLASFLNSHGFPLGDADGDGTVQLSDFGILSSNFRQSGEYTDGDFDKSGLIDFRDFVILAMHFGTSATITTVPEPVAFTSSLLSSLAILTLTRRVNRQLAATQPTRGAGK